MPGSWCWLCPVFAGLLVLCWCFLFPLIHTRPLIGNALSPICDLTWLHGTLVKKNLDEVRGDCLMNRFLVSLLLRMYRSISSLLSRFFFYMSLAWACVVMLFEICQWINRFNVFDVVVNVSEEITPEGPNSVVMFSFCLGEEIMEDRYSLLW